MARFDAYELEQMRLRAEEAEERRRIWCADRTTHLMRELEIGEKLAAYLAANEWGHQRTDNQVAALELHHARF